MNPSGWPTCRPDPDGYGNMSRTYAFFRSATRSHPSLSGPVGFGVRHVPSARHRSCHVRSSSPASFAEYRKGSDSGADLASDMTTERSEAPSALPTAAVPLEPLPTFLVGKVYPAGNAP